MTHRPGRAQRSASDLASLLGRIDGRGYGAYRELLGEWNLGEFLLAVDHVQADPFASPSRMRVRVPMPLAGFPRSLFLGSVRRMALEDFLARVFRARVRQEHRRKLGSGKSGLISIDAGGQEVLERAACRVEEEFVEARISVGLPAAGRSVLGREARTLLLEILPSVVRGSLFYRSLDSDLVSRFVKTVEDAEALRQALPMRGLVAFVADGSVLPRRSGVDDRPLPVPPARPFVSPPELRVTMETPNRGPVTGMGIPEGVTLIVGGGFHGKSTLLRALERGVYNHIPGDGREYVVTRATAVKIRAEDGRRVEKVDISPFISSLPTGQDTREFSTDNASGSTSQAANIIEALEVGVEVLLIDEDTSATNFMVRDRKMQLLVSKEQEPITPFVDRVRELYEKLGVSTVLVMGGVGDYFAVADTVIMMDSFQPKVVTDQAKAIAAAGEARSEEAREPLLPPTPRAPVPSSVDPFRRGKVKIQARGVGTLVFGEEVVDLSAVEQLVDASQTRAIGEALYYALRRGYLDGELTLAEILKAVYADIGEGGVEVISRMSEEHPGELALPRPQEVAAALNRLRSLAMRQRK